MFLRFFRTPSKGPYETGYACRLAIRILLILLEQIEYALQKTS